MSIGKNIRKYREQKGWTQGELGKMVGVSSAGISFWERDMREPNLATIEKLAEIFEVPRSALLGEPMSPTTDHSHWIPVLGRVAAGIPIEMIEDIIDYEEVDDKYGECFALQISGDSMSPRFLRCDVVIVKRQEDVESGEIAIVCVNGQDATCKKVLKHDNGITLVSLNPLYEPRFFTEEEINSMPISILGKVIELRGKL